MAAYIFQFSSNNIVVIWLVNIFLTASEVYTIVSIADYTIQFYDLQLQIVQIKLYKFIYNERNNRNKSLSVPIIELWPDDKVDKDLEPFINITKSTSSFIGLYY